MNWITGGSASSGVIFFPVGTYIVDDSINFSSSTTIGIHFLGVGTASVIEAVNLPGQAVLSRSGGPNNETSIITIEKLYIFNGGTLGAGILLACSSLGASIRDCFVHADIGISCGEFINPTLVTTAQTSSGTTLTFMGGVPSVIIEAFDNSGLNAMNVADLTNPGSITAGTTVAGVTSTTITLSAPVAGTVGINDSIQFTYNQQISVQTAWQVVIERVHCEAHHDYIPGSFGIAIQENSTLINVDMDSYDHAIRMCGVGNAIICPHLETNRKAIVLGIMSNGVLQTGSNFSISALGAESNGTTIEVLSSMGVGVIEGSGVQVSAFAVPYTGNVPVSGVSVTGSVSGATGTAAVAYSVPHSQYEITLTSVTGTFVFSGEQINVNTNAPTSSASVLHFSSVPAAVINVANNGKGSDINVFDITGTTQFLGNVISANSTSVTVTSTVTVVGGDNREFIFAGDSVGDGVNIPTRTGINGFVSGSGGSGTVCGPLSCQGEYGFHGSTLLGNVVISGCGFQGEFNQSAIDFDGSGEGQSNVTFISCEARSDVPGRPAWVTPAIAGDAQYINCNLDQPKYILNNLRQYPYVQFGDEFFVTDSTVTTFGTTIAGGSTNPVRALASSVITGVTNGGTSIGSPTIHFATTPSGIVTGAVIGSSGRITTGIQPFPVGTTVQSQNGTTVTASANATAAILTGDTIGFVNWTVSGA